MSEHELDDLSLDFTDVEGAGGFQPLPRGTYLLTVTDWELTEVKNAGGKLPVGTPGIRWEFVVEDGDYENRRLWTSHWLTAQSMPYLKGFLAATGVFSEEELAGPLGKASEVANRVVDERPKVAAKVRIQKNNSDFNEISAFLPASEYKGADAERSNSLMP
jgi:hypothetical protein